jgi:hypothetical protein
MDAASLSSPSPLSNIPSLFPTIRFNFGGVGKSDGIFDNGEGELSDAACILDWLQQYNTNSKICWVAGFSFGAWIGMQLLMRRPELNGFVSVSPPANMRDFSFLAPCPSSGLIIQKTKILSICRRRHCDKSIYFRSPH